MDDGIGPGYGILMAALFLLVSGCLHGFRLALEELSDNDLEEIRKKKPSRFEFLESVTENPARFHATLQVITTLFGFLTGYFAINSFSKLLYASLRTVSLFRNWGVVGIEAVTLIVVVLITLIVLVTMGILVPQTICRLNPQRAVWKLAAPVHAMMVFFRPLTAVVSGLCIVIFKLFGIDRSRLTDDVTEEELIELVDEAHEQGVILESEAEMIQNIIDFSDKSAKDIMTHRKNIVALDGAAIFSDAVQKILTANNSRYPVYLDDIDNIIGMVHLKDLMEKMAEKKYDNCELHKIPHLIREASFIPETRGIDAIFKNMQAKNIHMAIVVDEYGQTSGLVTMEDILEEIVGDIEDEYDESEQFIEKSPLDDSLQMDGLTPLEQVGEVLNVDFSDQEFETLNGYLTSLLDHIPEAGDQEVCGKGYRFRILSVDQNIIQKVRVEKLEEEREDMSCQDIQNLRT